MKKMLVFENEEKRVIKDANDLINFYCNEIDHCDECPFDELCTRIKNSNADLNVPEVFNKVTDLIR